MIDKTGGSLAAALEREHREIDEGIERFAAHPRSEDGTESLLHSVASLRRHIYLEEDFLFPALRDDGSDGLIAPIFVMLREHAQIWQRLEELERALEAGVPDAPQLCHQLLVQLGHHNMKEERILYPQADTALPPAAAARLSAFLETGRLPDGWVCLRARS